jgi:hypothetical protein
MVNYAPKLAVSKLVNSLKGISSLMMRKNNDPIIRKKLWGWGFVVAKSLCRMQLRQRANFCCLQVY